MNIDLYIDELNKEKQIINKYGVLTQLKYLQSEIFELNEAIIEYEHLLSNGVYMSNGYIAEELADVMVMLKQFQLHYEISNDIIQQIMYRKIDRQIERIAKESRNK